MNYFFLFFFLLLTLFLLIIYILYCQYSKGYINNITKLPNENAFFQKNKKNFNFILLLDIYKFYKLNEIYGIEKSKLILIKLSLFLKKFCEKYNLKLYHLSNDQFLLYGEGFKLSDSKKNNFVNEIIYDLLFNKISINIEKDFFIDLDIIVGISMEKDFCLKKANIALNEAYAEGVSYLGYCNIPNDKISSENIFYWKNEIEEALLEDRIKVVYQPIFDKNKNIIKYESLIRLSKNEKLISPSKFLEIAYQNNLSRNLVKFVIDQTFDMMKHSNVLFSINLSFTDIKDPIIRKYLKNKIITNNFGDKLVIEIVENEDITDYYLLSEFIDELKNIGVKFAIDDFGTGYSNYLYILNIKPDYLKIDGSLIKDINTNKEAYLVVQSIISLAHSLNMKVIVEYVHSEEIFKTCKELNADEFQGFYLSEPLVNLK